MAIKLDIDNSSVKVLKSYLEQISKLMDEVTDPVELSGLSKEFDRVNSKVKSLNDSVDELDLSDKIRDTKEELKPLSSQLGDVTDQMYALAAAGKSNTKEFKDLESTAGKMKATMITVDQSIDDLSSNRGIGSLGEQFGGVASSLASLDFERSAKQAKALAANASSISFASAGKSLKQLGSTFASLGKALLTNPIFLIGAIITAITVAIVYLLDELGLLQPLLDVVGKYFGMLMIPIDAAIQAFKNLTDMLGLTNHAATEASEAISSGATKAADATEKNSKLIIQSLDAEMELIKAKGELSDEDFETMIAMEREKVRLLAETAEARMLEAEAAVQAAIVKGDLSEEELTDLKKNRDELVLASKKATADINLTEVKADKSRKDRREKDTADELANQADRLAKHKKYLSDRLNAERSIEDLRNELTDLQSVTEEEKFDNSIERNQEQYNRLIEDVKSNESLLQSEKDSIIDTYNQLREEKEDQLRANKKLKEDERIAKEKADDEVKFQEGLVLKEEQDALLRELQNTKLQNEIDDISEKYDKQLALAENNAELTVALEKAKSEEIIKLREEEAVANKAITDAENAMKLQGAQDILASIMTVAGEASAVSKAAAVANITIDTYKGAMAAFSAYAAFPVLGVAAAAGVAAVGAINIKKVLSTPTPGKKSGGGGGGGSAPSVPSAPAAPSLSLFGSSSDNNSLGDTKSAERRNENTNITVKAVVSETEITETQKRVSRYEKNAEL